MKQKRHPLLKNIPTPRRIDNDNLPAGYQAAKEVILAKARAKYAGKMPAGCSDIDVLFGRNDFQIIFKHEKKGPEPLAYTSRLNPKTGVREAIVILSPPDDEYAYISFLKFQNTRKSEAYWLNDRRAIKACIEEMSYKITYTKPPAYRLNFHAISELVQHDPKIVLEKKHIFKCEKLPKLIVTFTDDMNGKFTWTVQRDGKKSKKIKLTTHMVNQREKVSEISFF